MGLLVGLVTLEVPLATLAVPAWGSPLLGRRDVPHTNSASCLEGLGSEHLPSPHPRIYPALAIYWLQHPLWGGRAQGDEVLVSGAGSKEAECGPLPSDA